MREKVNYFIEKLKLKGMELRLDETLAQAEREGLSIDEVLYRLLHAEYEMRVNKQLESRITQAKLPWSWTLDTFPFEKQPSINKTQIMGMANLGFIKRYENIIFIGKPGAGKTGLALGLLRLALMNGYRGKFYNAQDLLNELYSSLADRTTSRLLKKLYHYDVLVIDELGYLTLNNEQINIFFKLIDMRYQKKPTIITTNLDYPEWYGVFKQKELVDAMLDRFKHFCTTIRIEGDSLRQAQEDNEKPKDKKR